MVSEAGIQVFRDSADARSRLIRWPASPAICKVAPIRLDRREDESLIRSLIILALICQLGITGCATPSAPEDGDDMEATIARSYLRRVAFGMPFNEWILLRWRKSEMPLDVFLPEPPPGLFSDPGETMDVVRSAILAWTDVAGPGVPSFVFGDNAKDADIRVSWAPEPDGDWYVAYCSYDYLKIRLRQFGVDYLLISGRSERGTVVGSQLIHAVVMHEVGHALGLAGHSKNPLDVMYGTITPGFDYEISASDRLTLMELYSKPIGKRVVGAKHE